MSALAARQGCRVKAPLHPMPRLGRSAAVKGKAAPPSSLGLVVSCGAMPCARVVRRPILLLELGALDSLSTPLTACLVSRRQRVGREVSRTAEDTLPPADTLSFRVASLSHRGRAGGPRAHAVRSEADAGMDGCRRAATFEDAVMRGVRPLLRVAAQPPLLW